VIKKRSEIEIPHGLTRRKFLTGMLASSTVGLGGLLGCSTVQFGSDQSYLTQILKPENQSTISFWLDVILQQVRDQRLVPPRAAYNLGMPLAAGFLAANAITHDYQEPFGVGDGPANADPEVAYGVAFAIAVAEVFQQPFVIERRRFLNSFANNESKTLGIEVGERIGRYIVRMRNDDGAEPSEVNFYFDNYSRRTDQLKWSPTGPFYSATPGAAFDSFERGLFPSHGKIKPWTMRASDQFRVEDFYDIDSPEFAQDFDMIRRLGGEDSQERTTEQSEIAIFWEDGPWGITPPGHYLYIAMQLLQDAEPIFIKQARNFALLGMTQCDASISAWDNKYHHDILRPESAIRIRADKFSNSDPRVVKQSNWRSYIPTPSFPAYTSGHSTFAGAAELITLILGEDKVSFSGVSPDLVLWPQLAGITRHWTSISEMLEEGGMSRLYGGVHWELDHTNAFKSGQAIARQAFTTMFQARV